MYSYNIQDEVFKTTEFGIIRGVELSYWSDINRLAMRNGWLNSSLVYMGTFETEESDDVYSLFRDTEQNRNYILVL